MANLTHDNNGKGSKAPGTNGTTAKAAPTATEAIDLTVDLSGLKVPALTARLEALEKAIEGFEAVADAARACNREIAGRLHGAGVSKHVVGGEERRVRGVNGSSPPEYQLYGLTVKKPKTAPVVDIANL